MTEIDIDMPGLQNTARAITRIERAMKLHGLRVMSRGTLKKYPGCMHWHFKRAGNTKGTLEVTLWSKSNRLCFKIQDGRRAEWIDELIPKLKSELESRRRERKNPGS